MMVEKYDSEKNTITVQPFERRNTMQLNIATDYAIRYGKAAENSVIQRVVRESENFTAFYL